MYQHRPYSPYYYTKKLIGQFMALLSLVLFSAVKQPSYLIRQSDIVCSGYNMVM